MARSKRPSISEQPDPATLAPVHGFLIDIDGVFEFGLHEFIVEVLGQLAGLGGQIERDYLFYE